MNFFEKKCCTLLDTSVSGSPIIQNGKIVGAVTHVLVNDPPKGYGRFIEEMLDQWVIRVFLRVIKELNNITLRIIKKCTTLNIAHNQENWYENKGTIQKQSFVYFWPDSMISNECFLCNNPNVGLSFNEARSYVKCYMGDTGLLLSHAFDENEFLSLTLVRNDLSVFCLTLCDMLEKQAKFNARKIKKEK